MVPCPATEKLQRLLAHRLGVDEHQDIEAHVNNCSRCQHAIEVLLDNNQLDHWRKLLAQDPHDAGEATEAAFLGPLKSRPPQDSVPVTTANASSDERIGKYVLRKELGGGAFGKVYLGHDVEMNRPVAIKVPTGALLASTQARDQFLHEARSVARLRHANIVMVHDLGQDEGGRCYLVYDFIEGTSLAERLQHGPLPPREAAAIVAQIADALHYAHLQGVIHRDIKPANILLDAKGKPFVTDFGIAVREEDLAKQRGLRVGTPAYMSPEQVRGEGHLIDGRTDIYCLGVLFYETLTGQRPFQADPVAALYDLILYREAKPPRLLDDSIPRELERICLKAMAKRITDRHTTAQDVADDLRSALAVSQTAAVDPGTAGTASQATSLTGAVPVIPKGLRSFGPEDAEFFLRLLPGPHDRLGLPESLKFWKVRIESTDPEPAFRVGLIHGPSGCGKTSLIRAGLLPRLARSIVPIYVEALREGTEDRLLGKLRRLVPGADVVSAIASLRQGAGLEPGQKVLIVIDQLEQWLLADAGNFAASRLVAALRQSDGVRVQFLLMVRDDFWSASARLFDELEISMDNESNLRMVDLFDRVHARRVLEFFGQAYECLPARSAEITAEQRSFVDQAVDGLSQDGKVISVRLSLFADMMKARPWTPQSLTAVGGPQGVGVKFLEETFSAATANAEHRQDEEPARALLAVLLPESGTEIKGQMRARAELLKASGLENQPARFSRVLKTLDQELRIITPTEPPEKAMESSVAADAGYYQLTHDYLVIPLREWLTRGKKATWQGRAELCLEERAAQWSRGHDRRFLPSLFEFVRIWLAVPGRRQKPEQQAMMRVVGRRIGSVATLVVLALVSAGWAAWELHGVYRARGLVQAICAATPAEADRLIEKELPAYQRWAGTELLQIATDPTAEPGKRLRASLTCLPRQLEFLAEQLLECPLEEFEVICKYLKPHRPLLEPALWSVLRDAKRKDKEQFSAGLALAVIAPDSSEWSAKEAAFLTRRLLASRPGEQNGLRRQLRPIQSRLLDPLRTTFKDPGEDATVRQAAAGALIDFVPDDPVALAELIRSVVEVMASEPLPGEYRDMLGKLTSNPSLHKKLTPVLIEIAAFEPRPHLAEKSRVELGRRRALAAISLIKLGFWEHSLPAFKANGDPESMMQFAIHARDLGLTSQDLVRGLYSADEKVRLGCLLALGRFPLDQIVDADRLVEMLQRTCRTELRSSIHAASNWLLQKWGKEMDPKGLSTDRQPPVFEHARPREWFTLTIDEEAMTFVTFGPGRFQMGSSETEELRQTDEKYRWVHLTRPFAVGDREITVGQWQRFLADQSFKRAVSIDSKAWQERDKRTAKYWEPWRPAYHVTWFEAVDFCRWLTLRAGMSEEDQCYTLLGTDEKEKLPIWKFHPQRRGFRLPLEAEWEFAARAGTTTTFSFGSDHGMVKHFAVFLENLPGQPYRQPLRGGTRPPNPRGLFDMHGNVSEWCHDWRGKGKGPFGPEDHLDPTGADEGTTRFYRGGCFDNYSRHCRTACRISDAPAYHFAFVGFRVVCTLPAEKK